MQFLTGITLLLTYQLAGEVFVRFLALPVPGPVAGMLFLLITLALRRDMPSESLEFTATALLKHLSLLFVPAGVGVIVHLNRIGSEWLPIGVALILSTLISLMVTALAMSLIQRILPAGGPHRE